MASVNHYSHDDGEDQSSSSADIEMKYNEEEQEGSESGRSAGNHTVVSLMKTLQLMEQKMAHLELQVKAQTIGRKGKDLSSLASTNLGESIYSDHLGDIRHSTRRKHSLQANQLRVCCTEPFLIGHD